MRRLFAWALTVIIGVSTLFFAPVIRRAYQAAQPPERQESTEHDVLRVAVCITWEGNGRSILNWVKQMVADYEKKNPRVLVDVETFQPAGLATALQSATQCPDVVLFPPGCFDPALGIALPAELLASQGLSPARAAGSTCVMVGWQAYQVVADPQIAQQHGLSLAAGWGSQGWRQAVDCLLTPAGKIQQPNGGLVWGQDGPGGNMAALVESADTPSQWAGVLDQGGTGLGTRSAAWAGYAAGRYGLLIGSGRDVLRAQQLKTNKDRDFVTWPLAGSLLYTDMVYYAAVTHQAEDFAVDFVHLLCTDGQQSLAECGINPTRQDLYNPPTPVLFAPARAQTAALQAFHTAAAQLLAGTCDPAAYAQARQAVLG